MARNRKLCVDVAKDVLAQLKAGRFEAYEGQYCWVESTKQSEYFNRYSGVYKMGEYGGRDVIIEPDQSFQKAFKENKNIKCGVCALGSAFVSLVNLKNKCTLGDIENVDFDKLVRLFGGKNVTLMETAFEKEPMARHSDVSVEGYLIEAAVAYGEKYSDPDSRLRAIMQNVIRNNGDFTLPKRLVAKFRREFEPQTA